MLCSLVYPGNFVAFVTCMFKDYEDLIVAGMLKKGYTVGVVASDGKLTHGDETRPAVITTFKVETRDEAKKATDIFKDLIAVLAEKKVLYYSVVVSAYVDSSWIASNIELPKPAPPQEVPQPIPEPDKNLN